MMHQMAALNLNVGSLFESIMKFHSFQDPTGSVHKKVTKVMGVVSFHIAQAPILLASSFGSSGTKVCQFFYPSFFSLKVP